MWRPLCVLLLLPGAVACPATQWNVGPGLTYTAPSQVAQLVGDGDTVNIMVDSYAGDVTNWTADDLLLRGVNGHAIIPANGQAWGGKAIWVIQGNNTTVEYIAFLDCTVPDMNGAGIRQEGQHLTVRHCVFGNNENGILAGDVSPSTITIEHSEFYDNGYGDGFSHNLYINHVDTLFFRYNYSHHAHVGHELKSRAHVNYIEYNRFSNEATGDASREIDLPNGGVTYLIGNVIQQGPLGQNSNLVGYGLEGLNNPPPHELYVINNTLVNEKNVGSFFSVDIATYFKCYSNILTGGGNFIDGSFPTITDTVGNLREPDINAMMFTAPGNYDYHLTSSSPALAAGFPAGYSNSGYALVAWDEYVHPVGRTVRCQHATLDAGAFESCTVGLSDIAEPDVAIWPDPATDHIRVSWGPVISGCTIQLHDLQGHLVKELRWESGPITIPLSGLASGTYTLRIIADGQVLTRQFVKLAGTR